MVSISTGSAEATPQDTAAWVMLTYNRSRSSAVVVFDAAVKMSFSASSSVTLA